MQTAERVLLAEDDEGARSACREALEQEGFEVVAVGTAKAASQAIAQGDLVGGAVDLVLPDAEGLDLLREMKTRDPDVCLVLMTGYASLDSAIEAVRAGAYDYLRKPFDATDLARTMRRGVEARALARRNRALVAELRKANEVLARREKALERQVQVATREINALIELGKRITADPEPDRVLADVLQVGVQLVGAACAAVFRLGPAGNELVGHLALALPGTDVGALSIPFGQSVLSRAIASQEPVVENDLVLDPSVPDELLRSLGLGSVLAVPLLGAEGLEGVLAFFDKVEGHFGQHEVDIAAALAFEAAHAFARARLHARDASEVRRRGDFVPIQDIAKRE